MACVVEDAMLLVVITEINYGIDLMHFLLPFSFLLPFLLFTWPSQVLNEKIRELNQGDMSLAKARLIKKPRFPVYACNAKHIKSLYSAVRDFRDSEGRQLSEVFMKLPSKALYPDYYEVSKTYWVLVE